MDRPRNLGQLNTGEWDQLHTILERFEKAWHEADTVVLADFVPPPEEPLRTVVFQELVKADLANRWQRHQEIYLEDYLNRFPDLGTPQTVSPQLIYQEYCIRKRYADRPELASYQARFPNQFADLQRLLHEQPPPSTVIPGTRRPDPGTGTLKPAGTSMVKREEPVKREVLPVGGGYTLFRRLGSGSFGEVWRAEAPGGVEVAVKIIHRPLDHQEAQRELQALELIKGLRHNFLLQTQAYWSLEDRLLIVMDLADGSLRDRLEECQRQGQTGIPLDELLIYFREAAEALDFLHGRQVQHRDIKPDNILLLGQHVKVADFGLARLQGTRSMVTATGSGTPAYMAPEVWGNRVHQHSDQYSLAATFVELRLGRRLFASDNLPALMMDALQSTPDLTSLPEAEQQALHKALAKDPTQRYPSCRDFVQALETATKENKPRQPLNGEDRPHRNVAVWALLGTVFFLLVLLGLAVYFRPTPAPQREAVWLPPGCEPQADAEMVMVGEMKLYDHMAKVINGKRIPFRLIPHEAESDPPTFYMMENKVSNELFLLALADPGCQKLLDEEKKVHPQTIRREWELGGIADDKDLGIPGNEQLPVLRVTVTEAYLFARWLGGHLPSVNQWNKAGGKLNNDPHPFLASSWEGDDIAINRRQKGPMPVGTAAKDISRFKCRDMAGNGREWTCTLSEAGGTVPAPDPSDKLFVVVRGKSYIAPEPFIFTDHREILPYLQPYPDVSFRVVLELSLLH
jgi:hypothetical protein